ncbi:MAG: hypothetical protein SFT94_00195 [Pseudanabaenaceae cyanobacterium bins.68]|nr:hypothetical protein [Pseudanabaenaceae cyanobacterium bins.68]
MAANHDLSELDLDEQLAVVEANLTDLKQRYHQIQVARRDRLPLEIQKQELKQDLRQTQISDWRDRQVLVEELAGIEQRLAEISFELESRLIAWDSLREIFWQVLRFGGVGIILGWYLCSLSK